MLSRPNLLARFLALSGPERRTVLAAAVVLPLLRAGLQVFGLERVQRWLHRETPAGPALLTIDDARRLGTLVNGAALRVLDRDACLTRSLYLWWLLQRRGAGAKLRIGVRLEEGALEAHAWVECEGIPVNDRPDVGSDFPPFMDSISPRRFDTP